MSMTLKQKINYRPIVDIHCSNIAWGPIIFVNGVSMETQFWVKWGPNGDPRQQKWGPKKPLFEKLTEMR